MGLLSTNTAADHFYPIDAVIERYRSTVSYQVKLKSIGQEKTEIIHYYFKKPGYVRMDFLTPFKGAVLIYSPVTKQVKLWPFGYRKFPGLTFSPDNSLIQSSTGQRIDRSDIGALYENVKLLKDHGRIDHVEFESNDKENTLHISIVGENGFTLGAVAHYQLWLNQESGFPVKVLSQDTQGRILETVEMEDLKIDPEFPVNFFNQ